MSYRTTKFVVGVSFVAVLFAVAKYLEIDGQVKGSPYWTSHPTQARAFGTHMEDAHVEVTGSTIAVNPEIKCFIWRELSHSFIRTGIFSSRRVINTESSVRGVFPNPIIMRLCMKDRWQIEVDGKKYIPVLTSGGTLIGGFDPIDGSHHFVRAINPAGGSLEWKASFESIQPDKAPLTMSMPSTDHTEARSHVTDVAHLEY